MTERSVEAPSCLRESTVGAAGARGAASVSVALLGPSCRPCWLRGASGRRTGRLAVARKGRPGRRAGGSGRHWLIASAAIGMECFKLVNTDAVLAGGADGPIARTRHGPHSTAPHVAKRAAQRWWRQSQETHNRSHTMEEPEGQPGSQRWVGRWVAGGEPVRHVRCFLITQHPHPTDQQAGRLQARPAPRERGGSGGQEAQGGTWVPLGH